MTSLAIVIFIIASVIQLYFWISQLDIINRKMIDPGEIIHDWPSVSVIIAVKDEAGKLATLLKELKTQNYDDYEIIIIDDHSTDSLAAIIESDLSMMVQYYSLPVNITGKKAAVSYGITKCKGDWIILTDADCMPKSELWIRSMMNYSAEADVILGYSPSLPSKNMISQFYSYENWYIAMQYFSMAILGKAYMGVGRNMAFSKALFTKIGGYESHMDILSGNDDLFIQSLPTDTRITVNLERSAWIITEGISKISQYFHRKRRHLTTANHYSATIKFWLMIIFASHLFWYVSLLFIDNGIWLINGLMIRYLIILLVALRSRKRLTPPINIFLLPFFDIILIIVYTVMGFSMLVPKKNW